MKENCKSLIIRNLSPKVNEQDLKSIFDMISPVQSLSIIPNLECGVIEFQDHRGAEQALLAMNQRPLYGEVVSIEWNYDDAKIFIKHLHSNITRNVLLDAFESYQTTHVRLIKHHLGQYAVLSFPNTICAEIAAFEMNGQLLLSQPIEIVLDDDENSSISSRRSSSTDSITSLSTLSYEYIFAKTPLYHTTIYVKNLPKNVSKQEVISLLQQYGTLHDVHVDTNKRKAVIE